MEVLQVTVTTVSLFIMPYSDKLMSMQFQPWTALLSTMVTLSISADAGICMTIADETVIIPAIVPDKSLFLFI